MAYPDTPAESARFGGATTAAHRRRNNLVADRLCFVRAAPSPQLAVGITNSAPLAMLCGQRCITLFCLV